MSKSSYLIKNMGILTISNFSSKILVFLLVPLYTSVLSTKEYGTYDLAVSTATLLYPILTLNIVDAVMRFLMDKESDKKAIASIGLKYVSISSVLFGFIMLFFYITGIWSDINGLEGYIFSYYISYVINQFFIQFAKGLEKVKNMGVAGVLSTIVTIIANLFFLLVIKWGLIGFFLANILAQIVSAIYLFLKTEIYNYIEIKRQPIALRREMLIYSVPLIATVVGWWVNSCADKYIVTFILGISANGLLSVSYKIPQIINTIQGIFTQAWQISAIKEYGSSDTADFYGKTFIVINLMMCIVCSFLIFMTRPLAYILYANDFYEAWKYVPFLLVSSVLNCASGLLGPILSAKKNSKAMMWSAIVGAVANIIMNIVFVNLTGIQGATFATLVSSYIIYIIRKYADEVEAYLEKHLAIKDVHIVISHNDSDHINGISALMEYLYENNYTVTLYTSLYLKATKEILDILDDDRRTEKATREHILELFNNIKDIVEKAEEYEFTVKNAEVDTKVSTGKIVGPTVDEFAAVVAEAIEKQSSGAKIDDETVMNAASVQLNIKIDDASEVLLCGDASPVYLHDLDKYDLIQLPHHGKLESAQKIFDALEDSYIKEFLVSDNTGSGATSGGSDKLIEYMKTEKMNAAYNTKNGVIKLPKETGYDGYGNGSSSERKVKLGGMDCNKWEWYCM